MMPKAGAIAVMLTLMPLGVAADGMSPKGYWLTENGKAIVKFAECDQTKICGHIVWTANPRDDSGKLKLDVENPDPALRTQPVCGIRLIGEMQSVSSTKFEDGWVYNPRSGDTYSAEVQVLSSGQLKMRGYLGISLLGSSQTWTRVKDDRGGC